MCSYESYDVCRFYGQIYIKIPNYKPVEIKKLLSFAELGSFEKNYAYDGS